MSSICLETFTHGCSKAIFGGVCHSIVSRSLMADEEREHVVRFVDFMGAHANDTNLCMREFSKSLTGWYINPKLGSAHDWKH